ncbi:oligosaccharide flippase family protein [Priestia aryabhattai]|uniref:oligosaccharide flippase family protein n=1 Tax=Priestia aryabhattai TaxID=412384 RepID=UPI003CC35AD3
MLKLSSINLLLRIITLGSKFLLIMGMTRLLAPAEVGVYGVLSTTIGLSIYIVGMDFYVFNTREILSSKSENKEFFIRDQFLFHIFSYVIFLPILIILFILNIIPVKYAFIFYVLLVLEHLSQEFNRVFITLSKPIVANVTLFFRSGAWAYAAMILFFISDETHNLWTVLIGWVSGVLFSVLLSIYYLKDLNWHIVKSKKIDWKWVKRGVVVSFPLFVGNIALKLAEYLDRYFITFYKGKALVGAYTFYGSLSNLLVIFAQTGVIMILGPKVIRNFQSGDYKTYKIQMKKMTSGVIISTIFISLALAIGIIPITKLIGKPIYAENLSAYWTLIGAYAFSVLALLPHQTLYVRFKDKAIIVSSLISLGVSLLLNILLVPKFGLIGGATSTFGAFFMLFILKLIFAIKYKNAREPIEKN